MTRLIRVVCLLALVLCVPSLASAQLGIYQKKPAVVGEAYHIEGSVGVWNPSPTLTFSSSVDTRIGTQIDPVADLGIVEQKIPEIRVVGRPAKKHKVRFEYLPIRWNGDKLLEKTVDYNGQSFTLGLPVTSQIDLKLYRFAYEYDFLYYDRGFLGLVVDARYNRLKGAIATSGAVQMSASAETDAWVPTVGVISRGYLARNWAVTGELTMFRLPKSGPDTYQRWIDYDIYTTVNFVNAFGVQAGYRSIDVKYHVSGDEGALKLTGLYARGVLRF